MGKLRNRVKDYLLRHSVTSQVTSSISATNPVFWFHELFENTFKNHRFESKLVSEYFLEISIPHMKKLLKISIVILITYVYMNMFFTSLYKPSKIYTQLAQAVSLLILLICLGLTLFISSYANHTTVGLVSVLTVLFQNMVSQFDLKNTIEVVYSPIIQLIILVFSFIPINFTTSVCLSVLTISCLLLVTSLRISLAKDISAILKAQNETLINLSTDYKSPLDKFNVLHYLGGQILLWLSTLLNSCFMFTCNRLWRRSAFDTLGENLQRKKQSTASMADKLKWIGAVMPEIVKDEYLLHNLDNKGDKWVYIRTFDNVSILFADIVGFTKMSSNKTAPQVVTLLNDLFNRFDKLCQVTNCEKLGTLGDCYYCVAGCPKPRPDHAISCVEMGMGLCNVIQIFNKDNKEDVNMRVGIHTGRVNAAILGTERFRFDVYSYDVIVANMMESSGKPGTVHISQPVFELVRYAYNTEHGEDLEIKQEEDHGIEGMVQRSTFIKTYFIDPKYSHLQRKSYKIRKKVLYVERDDQRKEDSSSDGEFENTEEDGYNNNPGRKSINSKSFAVRIDEQVSYIEIIKYDPDQQIQCFNNLPINNFTLCFYDPEIEWHFQTHSIDHIQSFSLFSAKFSPLVESIMALICTSLLTFAALMFFVDDLTQLNNTNKIVMFYGLTIAFIIIEFWKASTYISLLQRNFERYFYLFFSHQFYMSFVCLYMTIMPNLMCFLFIYDCHAFTNDYYFQARYFSLSLFSLITGSLFVSAPSVVKVTALLLNFLQCIFVGSILTCEQFSNFVPIRPYFTCVGSLKLDSRYFNSRHLMEYFVQYLFTVIVLIVLVRERERNLRIFFYVSREAEIEREEALRAMISSQKLLFNIIPRYVFKYIKTKGESPGSTKCNYAVSIPKVAVVFACISNFFSKYYREDYKGGENALKLLHTIITKFDNILLKKDFKDVEKIKTINDCYMCASGLNTESTECNDSPYDHLVALMKYAFEMQKVLGNFNEFYIIGTDKFEIKIGYNFGPVTAGIIGSTKPLYDIWGDTVNVASRMYSTGKSGEIQVPHYVADELKPYFVFAYRDKIFVKGKGDMNTYICLKEALKAPVIP